MGARFRELLRGPEPLQTIAVHDVLSARLVEADGFKSVFVGSSNIAGNGYALPDAGLISLTELIEFGEVIASNIDIPAIADTDDGGPTAVHTFRAAQRLYKAGLGGIMLEDMQQTNRFGAPTKVVSANEMIEKIRAIRDASDLLVLARCDALSAGLTLNETLDRGVAYAEAGADVLYFSGLQTQDYPRAVRTVKRPLCTTVAADMPIAEVKRAGIGLALYTRLLQDIAMGAVHNALLELKTTGMMPNANKIALPRDFSATLIRTWEITGRARKYRVIP
jgi:2-methylisocitrate lyase-like PEP mutase family enzyme